MKSQYQEAMDLLTNSIEIDADKKLYDAELIKLGLLMKQCMESAQQAKLQELPMIIEKYEQVKVRYPQYFQSDN